MITEQHYTKRGEHPEDRIFKDREYIKRLQRHVYGVFDRLEKDLKLTESGQAHLFDYVFNEESDDISFEEYLDKMGVDYNEISIKEKSKSNYKNVEGLKVTSSILENDWDWDKDVERMDKEIAVKEWNKGIADFDKECGCKTTSSPLEEFNNDYDKLTEEQKMKCYEKALKMCEPPSKRKLDSEVKKNEWVHGMCNPPADDAKEYVKDCKSTGKKYNSVDAMLKGLMKKHD